ncbi:hypothetical protein LEM8419_00063 [Neolewinella maritima]|uniref:Uncharacterized protein n=1 Tax=Neolewinella maritima TaxID=1383882 RepID=A0ABM9AWD2_9BACT|nr:hypothetical protein [Neolewinella maritima]CAH0998717.1 hypothetical protein LEM8419_00063 [Neolewinella maritima]
MNAFLLLQEQDVADFRGTRSRAVRQRVEGNLRSAEFVGSLIELFGPRLADTLSVLSGGTPSLVDEQYLRLREGEDDDPYGQPPRGPGPSASIPS